MATDHDSPRFADRLVDAIAQRGAPACVGIDPVLERLPAPFRGPDPAAVIDAFSRAVIDLVAPIVPAVKLQSACFERYGSAGVAALERTAAHASKAGLAVVLDAKRGDIGLTAEHYAESAARLGAHAVTVNGYLGPDTLRPFLDRGLGIFVLVRTSNPDSDAIQSHRLADGRTVAEMMADQVATIGRPCTGRHGFSDVGAVVGATKAGEGAALRARMPDQIFLVPGYGAQGGRAEDVRAMLAPDGRGVLVTASRSVIYPADGKPWSMGVADAAKTFCDELQGIVRAPQVR